MSENGFNLVALLGASPAVVTETLYYLLVEETNQWGPVKSLTILTTDFGYGKKNELDQAMNLLQEIYPHCAPLPDVEWVRLESKSGTFLSDIITKEDASRVNETLYSLIQPLTAPEQPPLAVSAAGGRKTMTLAVSSVMQLLAREQDEVIHVLVNESGEQAKRFTAAKAENPAFEFWFPRPGHTTRVGDTELDHGQVEVQVSRAPIVPMRALLERTGVFDLNAGFEDTFSFATEMARYMAHPPKLRIDARHFTITLGDNLKVSRSSRLVLFLYLYALKKAQSDCYQTTCSGCDECGLSDHDLSFAHSNDIDRWMTIAVSESGNDFDDLRRTLSDYKVGASSVDDLDTELSSCNSEIKTKFKALFDKTPAFMCLNLPKGIVSRTTSKSLPKEKRPRALQFAGPIELVAPKE